MKVSPELDKLWGEILAELESARHKFPHPEATGYALMEEVGEVSRAVLEEDPARVRAELIQVCVMSIRLALEGDYSINPYRKNRGLEFLGPPETQENVSDDP